MKHALNHKYLTVTVMFSSLLLSSSNQPTRFRRNFYVTRPKKMERKKGKKRDSSANSEPLTTYNIQPVNISSASTIAGEEKVVDKTLHLTTEAK